MQMFRHSEHKYASFIISAVYAEIFLIASMGTYTAILFNDYV